MSQNLWILLEGTCEVFRQENGGEPGSLPLVLATLEPYAAFGEMSFFQTAPHSASVRGETRVKLLCLTKSQSDELLERAIGRGLEAGHQHYPHPGRADAAHG